MLCCSSIFAQSSLSLLAGIVSAIQFPASGLSAAEVDAKIAAAITASFKRVPSAVATLTPAAVCEADPSIERRRGALEAEIEHSKKDLERKIKDLQQQASAAEGRDRNMQAEIDTLTAAHKELMVDLEQRREALEQQARINTRPELRVFYRVFQSKVGHAFLALKVIASGMVTREKAMMETAIISGRLELRRSKHSWCFCSGLELLGSLVPLGSYVGLGASKVV